MLKLRTARDAVPVSFLWTTLRSGVTGPIHAGSRAEGLYTRAATPQENRLGTFFVPLLYSTGIGCPVAYLIQ